MRQNAAELISNEYASQQRQLHEVGNYGTMAQHYGPMVSQIIENLGISHLLDFGCGKRMGLTKTLKVKHKLTYQGYDPGAGLEELATAPIPAEMVCCIDVLEHVEPEYLDKTIDLLQELTEAVGFFTFHTGPAMKTLPDGRNAHLTQQPIEWWLEKMKDKFDLQTVQRVGDHSYYSIYYAKPAGIQSTTGERLSAEPKIILEH